MIKKIFSIISKILIRILIVLLVIALVFNISTLLSLNKIRQGGCAKAGYACLIVNSGSMVPTISVNDLVIIQKGVDTFEVGDAITYVSERGTLVTHRILEISESGYITQGDANNTPDKEVSRQRLLGKVIFVVPAAGQVAKLIISPFSLISVAGVVLIVMLVKKIRREWKKNEE